MSKLKAVLAIAGFSALAMAGPAAADNESGLYLGAAGGRVWYKDSCNNQPVPCGDVDPAYRGFGGWRFNRNFALELGYADLGKALGQGPVAGADFRYEKSVYSFDVSGVLTFKLAGDLHGFGRLGAYRARTEVSTWTSGALTTNGAMSNSAWFGGLGLEYQLWRFGLRAEWNHWMNVRDPSNGSTDDLDALMLGLSFRF